MERLGPFELNQIYTGDAFELAKELPDDSLGLVYTDPLYDDLGAYWWLAETSARVLAPDRACVAFCSKPKMPPVYYALAGGGLDYVTTLFYTVVAKQVRPAFHIGVMSWTTPAFVFAKGAYKCTPFLVDTFRDGTKPQNGFKWQKNLAVSLRWIEAFNRHGGVVLDPFCGSGSFLAAAKTLGMSFIGFEIDAERAGAARRRVAEARVQTRAPGIIMPPWEQLRFDC